MANQGGSSCRLRLPLRQDFELRSLARRTKDGPQARRLLALAAGDLHRIAGEFCGAGGRCDRSPTAAAHSNCSQHPATSAPRRSWLAHGFSVEQMVDSRAVRLATAKAERVVAGGGSIEVARVRIHGGRTARTRRRILVLRAICDARIARGRSGMFAPGPINASRQNGGVASPSSIRIQGCRCVERTCGRPRRAVHTSKIRS
jgi:hypothetical protein